VLVDDTFVAACAELRRLPFAVAYRRADVARRAGEHALQVERDAGPPQPGLQGRVRVATPAGLTACRLRCDGRFVGPAPSEVVAVPRTTGSACSNTWYWSGRRASNPLPQPWQGCALPSELLPLVGRGPILAKPWRRCSAVACWSYSSRGCEGTGGRNEETVAVAPGRMSNGAGDGNRTRINSLEGCRSYQIHLGNSTGPHRGSISLQSSDSFLLVKRQSSLAVRP
jgi:hypothetical protein